MLPLKWWGIWSLKGCWVSYKTPVSWWLQAVRHLSATAMRLIVCYMQFCPLTVNYKSNAIDFCFPHLKSVSMRIRHGNNLPFLHLQTPSYSHVYTLQVRKIQEFKSQEKQVEKFRNLFKSARFSSKTRIYLLCWNKKTQLHLNIHSIWKAHKRESQLAKLLMFSSRWILIPFSSQIWAHTDWAKLKPSQVLQHPKLFDHQRNTTNGKFCTWCIMKRDGSQNKGELKVLYNIASMLCIYGVYETKWVLC